MRIAQTYKTLSAHILGAWYLVNVEQCACVHAAHTRRESEREIHKYGTHIRCQNFVKTISAARISICFSYETVTSQVLQ